MHFIFQQETYEDSFDRLLSEILFAYYLKSYQLHWTLTITLNIDKSALSQQLSLTSESFNLFHWKFVQTYQEWGLNPRGHLSTGS